MANTLWTFGALVYDPARHELRRDGEAVAVSQRALALLQALLEARGQPVGKQALLEAAWPGLIVEDANLTVQIAALRKALGPGPGGQDWIVTVPRLGYRLLLPQAAAPVSDGRTLLPSLVVLPFRNIGGDPEQAYFARGIVEDLTNALSRFRTFTVVAPRKPAAATGDVEDPRQIAADLGVGYVLEGSVRKSGGRLRITTQLVDGASGKHLLAQTFDGAAGEVFDFQDRITESVAVVVEPNIQQAEIERSRHERPGSLAAHDLYLRALHAMSAETEAGNAAALALLDQALELEPDNAIMLSEAASSLDMRIALGWPLLTPDDRQKCRELARRGLLHAADDSKALALCALSLVQSCREYDLGMEVISRAVAINPNSMMALIAAGVCHLHCGKVEDAIAFFMRTTRLVPRNPHGYYALTGIAHGHMILGNYEEALAWATRSLVLNSNYDASYWMLIAANARLGRMDEARAHLAAYRKLAPGVTVASIRAGQAAKDPARTAAILEGLQRAGLPTG